MTILLWTIASIAGLIAVISLAVFFAAKNTNISEMGWAAFTLAGGVFMACLVILIQEQP